MSADLSNVIKKLIDVICTMRDDNNSRLDTLERKITDNNAELKKEITDLKAQITDNNAELKAQVGKMTMDVDIPEIDAYFGNVFGKRESSGNLPPAKRSSPAKSPPVCTAPTSKSPSLCTTHAGKGYMLNPKKFPVSTAPAAPPQPPAEKGLVSACIDGVCELCGKDVSKAHRGRDFGCGHQYHNDCAANHYGSREFKGCTTCRMRENAK